MPLKPVKLLPSIDNLSLLRSSGWSVAIHNDYNVNGNKMTFWLFTNDRNQFVKGEAGTDEDALGQCVEAAKEIGSVDEELASMRSDLRSKDEIIREMSESAREAEKRIEGEIALRKGAQKARDDLAKELGQIDLVLGNVSAFDGIKTREGKVAHAMRVAKFNHEHRREDFRDMLIDALIDCLQASKNLQASKKMSEGKR